MSDDFEPRRRRVKKGYRGGAHFERQYDIEDEEVAPKPRRWSRTGRSVLLAAVVVAVLLFGLIVGASIIQRRPPGDVVAGLFIDTPEKAFRSDRLSLLLLGLDYNYDSKDQPYSKGARSDTIMAVAINFPTQANPRGSVSILSVPRDMDAIYPDGHEDKINTAYALGTNPLDAARRSEKVVANFLGLPKFDRFITFRINAAKEVVDAIGGIDVVADSTMNYDDHWGHLSIHFIGGKKYHMNGEQAVSYSRFRHDACGDPCRIKRQQQVIRIVLNKLSSEKLNDLLHVTQFISILRRNVDTDVTDKEALTIANAMRGVDVKKIKAQQIPYTDDKDLRCCGNVLIADEHAKSDLVRKAFLESPVPTPPPTAAALAAIPASSISIDVRNGSGVQGVARRMAAVLRAKGFVINAVGDADKRGYPATEIHVHSNLAYAGERVRGAVPVKTAVLVQDPAGVAARAVSDVTVIIGGDWSGPAREASAVK